MCFVYVLRNPGHRENVIKIGQTTNLRTRLSNLNSGNYLPFDVLHVRRFDDTEDDWRYNRGFFRSKNVYTRFLSNIDIMRVGVKNGF